MANDSNTLTAVLDTLIPPSADGRLPGAGELGLADAIGEALGDSELLSQSLEALDESARQAGAACFAELGLDPRSECLRESAESNPALLPGLIFHTYSNYYRNPRVLEALGLEARPPFPLGYTLEAGDPTLLDPVRRRDPFYRKVD
jgi:hypothetical protein